MTEIQPVHPPLLECAIEAEKYVAASGWDQPIRLFAFVDAAEFAEAEPGLSQELTSAEGAEAASPAQEADAPDAVAAGDEVDDINDVGDDLNFDSDAQTPTGTQDEDEAVVSAYVTVEQDDLPPHEDVEELLAQIAWPPQVDGVGVSLERIVLPPGAEADLPEDPEAATQAALDHPGRADIRLFAAVLRTGERVCLVRQRAHDSDDQVAVGEEIAPGLLDALAATLED